MYRNLEGGGSYLENVDLLVGNWADKLTSKTNTQKNRFFLATGVKYFFFLENPSILSYIESVSKGPTLDVVVVWTLKLFPKGPLLT